MFKVMIAAVAISSSAAFAIQFDEQDVNVAYSLRCRGHLSNRQVERRERQSAFDAAAKLLNDRIQGNVAPHYPMPAEALGHP